MLRGAASMSRTNQKEYVSGDAVNENQYYIF